MHISPEELRPIISTLETLLAQLKSLGKVEDLPEEDSPEVKAKVAQRICLTCGITVPAGDFYMRGLHSACYSTTMRRLRDGKWTEAKRVAEGKLSVGGKPGRTAAIDVAEATEVIAQSIADQIAPRKVAEPKEKINKRTKRSK